MKKRILLWVVVLVVISSACNLTQSLAPTVNPTPSPQPPATQTAPPAPTSLPATATAPVLPPVPIVYYYFVAVESQTFPAGSVVILPDILILAPTLSDQARSPDPAANIRTALQAMIQDPRNAWTSRGVSITGITFSQGSAGVVLQGEYFGAGDVVLIAARMQMLMTVFAEAAVQTATITLNGKNVANLGISRESEAKPAGYAYTRAEIEAFMTEHEYRYRIIR